MKKIIFYLALLMTVYPLFTSLNAQKRSDLKILAPNWPLESLDEVILSREEWQPFPTYSAPEGFEQIPENVRKAHIQKGEKLLNAEWEPLPATVFLEYVRTGNRSHYESLSFGRREQLANLVLAEVFERKGRFLDQIVNGIWAICEESFWGVPAHMGLQEAGSGLPDVSEPVVDLFAAETAALMAWTYYLLKQELDEINPLITARMIHETDRRILTPFLTRRDWGWMGFRWRENPEDHRRVNNWNPWINSNILTAALIMEQDPERRLEIIHKSMDSIDNFVLPYPSDGGCDEGPSYWNRAGGALYDCLELLYSASDGKIDIFDQPLIRKMGQYISKAYISDPYFINFADASAKMRISAPLVYRYGEAIGDKPMMQFAAFTAEQTNFGQGTLDGNFGVLNRILPALFTIEKLRQTTPSEPFLRDVWLPDIQVMVARSESGSDDGFYIAAKSGHNAESHNHNDVGNYIIYYDGMPVLIDAGAQTYTAKTFSSQRYELWNNQSAYHNLPSVNGVMQQAGRQFEGEILDYSANGRRARFSLDISGAYPEDARVNSWNRTITLNRTRNVEIREEYALSEYIEPTNLHFLTPIDPKKTGSGLITLVNGETGQQFSINYDEQRFDYEIETVTIDDSRMSGSWGDRVYRITLVSRNKGLTDSFTIRIDD